MDSAKLSRARKAGPRWASVPGRPLEFKNKATVFDRKLSLCFWRRKRDWKPMKSVVFQSFTMCIRHFYDILFALYLRTIREPERTCELCPERGSNFIEISKGSEISRTENRVWSSGVIWLCQCSHGGCAKILEHLVKRAHNLMRVHHSSPNGTILVSSTACAVTFAHEYLSHLQAGNLSPVG